MKKQCATCIHKSAVTNPQAIGQLVHICRRNPPTSMAVTDGRVVQQLTAWPTVNPDHDYCGQYENPRALQAVKL